MEKILKRIFIKMGWIKESTDSSIKRVIIKERGNIYDIST